MVSIDKQKMGETVGRGVIFGETVGRGVIFGETGK
jgi:hypothetical protein